MKTHEDSGDVECSIQRADELAARQLAAGPVIAPVVVPATQLARLVAEPGAQLARLVEARRGALEPGGA